MRSTSREEWLVVRLSDVSARPLDGSDVADMTAVVRVTHRLHAEGVRVLGNPTALLSAHGHDLYTSMRLRLSLTHFTTPESAPN